MCKLTKNLKHYHYIVPYGTSFKRKFFIFARWGWTQKIFRLPPSDRTNSGRTNSKYFIGPLKAKKYLIILNCFNVKFYFSNACLNSVEHILFPSKQKFKRTDAWFQVSERFIFSLSAFKHWAFIIDGATTAFVQYSHFTLIRQ